MLRKILNGFEAVIAILIIMMVMPWIIRDLPRDLSRRQRIAENIIFYMLLITITIVLVDSFITWRMTW